MRKMYPVGATLFIWSMCCSAPCLAQQSPLSPPATVSNFEYDANGNITKLSQALGIAGLEHTTRLQYDALGRLLAHMDSFGGTINFEYNGRQDLTRVMDPRRLATTYDRDGHGGLIQLSSPDTGSTAYRRDAAGNILTRIDSRGVTTEFTYDGINRLTAIVHRWGSQPNQALAFRYDEADQGNPFGRGQLTSTTYRGGSSRFMHDALGRIVSTTQTTETGAGTVLNLTTSWRYDAAGNVTQLTYPSGRVLSIPHAAGQPVAMTLDTAAGGSTATLISGIQYAPFGEVQRWIWRQSNGSVLHERIFDTDGRIIRQSLGGMTRDLRYDAAGRLLAYVHCCGAQAGTGLNAQQFDQMFGYDQLGRLTHASFIGGASKYAYDASGNRTQRNDGKSLQFTYPAPNSNRIILAGPAPMNAIGHDNAGNTILDSRPSANWNAAYDLAGRLATLSRASSGAAAGNFVTSLGYLYNSFWQRIVKLTSVSTQCMSGTTGCTNSAPPSKAVVYVYGLGGEIIGEYRASDGTMLREYVWLGKIPIAAIAPDAMSAGTTSDIFFIHADHLNTPRVVVDQAGRSRWTWLGAEPFGASPPNTDPQGLGQFNFDLRFPGQIYDQDSGLVYNNYRDYDPSLGRYIQSDPIGLAGGINTYSYAGANPVLYIDPWGLIRYNAPPPRTVPVDGETSKRLVCLETCLMGRTRNLSLDLLVTGGAEKADHLPRSHHYKGEACDVSTSNPVSQDDMNNCAASCGFRGGQLEIFPKNPNRDHWHLQLTPGNGVPTIGPANGPIPIVYPKK